MLLCNKSVWDFPTNSTDNINKCSVILNEKVVRCLALLYTHTYTW